MLLNRSPETKNIDGVELSEPTVEGTSFDEKAVLFPVEKINDFAQLTVLSHQQVILSLALARDFGEVVTP